MQWTRAKVRVYSKFRSVPGKMCEKQIRKWKMGRSSERIQNVLFSQRNAGHPWRSNWIRVEYAYSLEKSRMICESGTLNLGNSQTGSYSCQCSSTSIGQEKETMEFVFLERRHGWHGTVVLCFSCRTSTVCSPLNQAPVFHRRFLSVNPP